MTAISYSSRGWMSKISLLSWSDSGCRLPTSPCVLTWQKEGSVQFSCSVMSNSLRPHGLNKAYQASLSITNLWSLLKLLSIESVMPSNHLILCRPLLLPSSIFPSIRDFSNESTLSTRWPKYWSLTFSICPSMNIQD